MNTSRCLVCKDVVMLRPAGWWCSSVTQLCDAAPWCSSVTQLRGTALWRSSVTQLRDAALWRSSVTQLRDASPWRSSVTQLCGAAPWCIFVAWCGLSLFYIFDLLRTTFMDCHEQPTSDEDSVRTHSRPCWASLMHLVSPDQDRMQFIGSYTDLIHTFIFIDLFIFIQKFSFRADLWGDDSWQNWLLVLKRMWTFTEKEVKYLSFCTEREMKKSSRTGSDYESFFSSCRIQKNSQHKSISVSSIIR